MMDLVFILVIFNIYKHFMIQIPLNVNSRIGGNAI